MIRINLLKNYAVLGPDADQAGYLPEEERNQILIDFFKRLALFVIGPVCFYLYESNHIPELQAKVAAQTKTLDELKTFNEKKKNLAEEIRRYETDQARLKDQMNFMSQVANEKANELRLFQYLQKNTPESVWLTRIELHGQDLSIGAESDVPGDVTKFLDNLAAAPFLQGVSPINQETKYDSLAKDISTVVFNVKANFAAGVKTP